LLARLRGKLKFCCLFGHGSQHLIAKLSLLASQVTPHDDHPLAQILDLTEGLLRQTLNFRLVRRHVALHFVLQTSDGCLDLTDFFHPSRPEAE